MSIADQAQAAAIAYQDARHDVQTQTREQLLSLGDAVTEAAFNLILAHQELDDRLAEAASMECPDSVVHEIMPGHRLPALVRELHDRQHVDFPWAVCPHDTCREALRLGQT